MFLVTGGAGFIGSHTVRALRAGGHDVRVLDDLSSGRPERIDGLGAELVVGDLTDAAVVRAAMAGVHHVIHLGARISVPESVADPALYHRVNTGGFLTVLEAARASGVQRVVYASSSAVYGSVPGLPKREDAVLEPGSPYAASKLANEAYASAATVAHGLATVGLRYFNVFGPGQDPEGPYGAVIPTFVSRALAGEALAIHGDGEQGRDFVHVSDVAAANVAAALAPELSGVFNIGGGRMLTVNQLAAQVRAAVGEGVRVVHESARSGDVRFSMADIAAASAWGWEPRADFDAALAETVRWFRDGGLSGR